MALYGTQSEWTVIENLWQWGLLLKNCNIYIFTAGDDENEENARVRPQQLNQVAQDGNLGLRNRALANRNARARMRVARKLIFIIFYFFYILHNFFW